MTTTAHRLGPGQLTFGETASEQEFGGQVTAVTLTPEVEEGDSIPVLDGGEVVDEGDTTWTLTGSFLQEFTTDSLIKWCHQNAGQQLPFVFRPRSDSALEATGTVTIRAVPFGGDVRTRNTSEFTFPVVGDVDLSDGDGGGASSSATVPPLDV